MRIFLQVCFFSHNFANELQILVAMKRISFFMFALLMCTCMQAQERIAFTCSAIDPQAVGNGNPRGP